MVEYVKKSFLDSKSLVKENQDGKEKGYYHFFNNRNIFLFTNHKIPSFYHFVAVIYIFENALTEK